MNQITGWRILRHVKKYEHRKSVEQPKYLTLAVSDYFSISPKKDEYAIHDCTVGRNETHVDSQHHYDYLTVACSDKAIRIYHLVNESKAVEKANSINKVAGKWTQKLENR